MLDLPDILHPRLCEVLYAVPSGPAGDANADGLRDASGDEFFELDNPHAQPIQLKGYTISDRNQGTAQLRFTFPTLELPPGGRVVVFNGHKASWKGPVGDRDRAPAAPHPDFHEAFIFTLKAPSSRVGLANAGDYLLLSDPAGRPVALATWGDYEEPPPQAPIVETLPMVTGQSAHRTPDGWRPHKEIDGVPFSPGRAPADEGTPSDPMEPAPGIGPLIGPGGG